MPAELQEQADEYESQDLFVPADAELQGHHSSSQIAEWRLREQEQWDHEVLARSGASSDPLPTADNLATNERFVPGTSNHATPARSRTPLDASMNDGPSETS